jgi:hypothetical protein
LSKYAKSPFLGGIMPSTIANVFCEAAASFGDDFLKNSSNQGEWRRFFSRAGEIQPKKEDLGLAAQNYMNNARTLYESGQIKVPWEIDKINLVYEKFSNIGKTLTDDPQWNKFWNDFKERNAGEIDNIDEHIAKAQKEIVYAYHFKVLGLAKYSDDQREQTLAQHPLQLICGRFKDGQTSQECLNSLTKKATDNLSNSVNAGIPDYQVYLNEKDKQTGKFRYSDNDVIQITVRQLEELRQGTNYKYIGENKAEEIISKALNDAQNKYQGSDEISVRSAKILDAVIFQQSPSFREIVSGLDAEITRQQADIQNMRGAKFTSKPAKLEALKVYRDAILLAGDATALAGAMNTLEPKQKEMLSGSRSPRTAAALDAVAEGIKSVKNSPASSPASSSTSTPESTPPVSPRFETIQRSEGVKKANFTIGTRTPSPVSSPESSPPPSPRGERKNSISIGSTRSSSDSSPSSSTPGTPQKGNAKAPSHADIQRAVTSAFAKSKTASKSEDKPKPDSDTPSTPTRREAPKRPGK